MQRRAKSFTGRRPASRRTRSTTPTARRRGTRPVARRPAARATPARPTRRGTTSRRTPSGRTRLSAKTTTEPQVIQAWAEERGGTPATVVRTTGRGGPGILRIDFPGYSGQGTLQPISWDEWFRIFEDRKLAFLYQERAANGELSRFSKVVARPKR